MIAQAVRLFTDPPPDEQAFGALVGCAHATVVVTRPPPRTVMVTASVSHSGFLPTINLGVWRKV
jgi:hypothetical protein